MLLGEVGVDQKLAHVRAVAGQRLCRLARPQQVRGVPHRALGQQAGLVLEQGVVGDVAVLVALAVAARLRVGDRRMPNPPPTRDLTGDLGGCRHVVSSMNPLSSRAQRGTLRQQERSLAALGMTACVSYRLMNSAATTRKAISAHCWTAPSVS